MSVIHISSFVGTSSQIESQVAIYLAELLSCGRGGEGCGGILLFCLVLGAVICCILCYIVGTELQSSGFCP